MVAPVHGDQPGLASADRSSPTILARDEWLFPWFPLKHPIAMIAIAMKQSLQNIFKVSQCSEQTIWPFDVQKRIQIVSCCTSITTSFFNQFFSDFGLGSAIPESVRSPGWSVPPRPCRRRARRSAIDPGTSPPLIGKPRETPSPMNHYGYYGYLSFHHGSQNIQWKPNSLFIINWQNVQWKPNTSGGSRLNVIDLEIWMVSYSKSSIWCWLTIYIYNVYTYIYM